MKRFSFTILFFIVFINSFAQVKTNDSKKVLPPNDGVYFGIFSCGATEDSVTMNRLDETKKLTGITPAWIYFSNNWFNGIKFPTHEVKLINKFGSTPFIRLMPRSDFTEKKPDPVYTLQNITDGVFDKELTKWADDARDSEIPMMIEFGTEVNGDWFPWSGAQNGKEPHRFISAYRHIIDIFKNESAYNITWVFHIDAVSEPNVEWNKMSNYYPGDDYIDWIGASIYGAQNPRDETENFLETFDSAYNVMRLISENKPLAILEFGTVVVKEKKIKPVWIKSVFKTVKDNRYPRIKALCYWNSRWENDDGTISDMRIDSSPDVLKIFRKYLSDGFFKQELIIK